VRGDRPDGIVDAKALDPQGADDDDNSGNEADHDRGPGRHEGARRCDGDESGDGAVQHHREVGLLHDEPGGDDRTEDPGRGGQVGVERDIGEEADAPEVDAQRRARVEAEPPKPEDEDAERRVGHVVARDRVRLSVDELADPRPQEERAGKPGEGALVVHHGRACEVLHPAGEEPAVRTPDPVRDDGVDEGVGDAEGEVDPEAGPLGHCAPDDRERDGAEDDLEEVAGCTGNRREPGERRRPDGRELVHRGDEA
jgi:hypothetical protein